jgi:hypothetical protein
MELWYTSSNDRALDFIKNFVDDYKKFAMSQIDFAPHIVTWACPQCDQDFKKKECFSDGKYCAMKHGDSQYIRGSDILMEDLREICVHK